MLCSRAMRVLGVGGHGRSLGRMWGQGRTVHVRNYVAEARAAKKIIHRSGLGVGSLERICGVRMIHTSNARSQKDDDQKNDDEKERMISALKTAIGFFFVPLLLLFVFGGGAGGGGARSESMAGLDRAQRPGQPIGEIQWNDFYQNLLLKVGPLVTTLIWIFLDFLCLGRGSGDCDSFWCQQSHSSPSSWCCISGQGFEHHHCEAGHPSGGEHGGQDQGG